MRRLLLALLLIPFFTSSSWADTSYGPYMFEDKQFGSGMVSDYADNNDLVIQVDVEQNKTEKKQSVNTNGNRPFAFEDKPGNPDGDLNDEAHSVMKVDAFKNQEKRESIKQGQKRKNGWGQKPTSIQRKSGGLQGKSR